MIGTFTHFFHNRTTPHETDQCEACLKGIPYRWHAYVSAWEPRTGLHFIFETTAQASDPFKDYFKTFDTLRGCHFIATRMAKRTNGRVIIRTKPADMSGLCVPEPPDLKQCLAIIWGLPADTLDTTT